jgi:hypothetical protein
MYLGSVDGAGCLRNAAPKKQYSVDPDRALCPLPPRIIWAMGNRLEREGPSDSDTVKSKCRTVTTSGPILAPL